MFRPFERSTIGERWRLVWREARYENNARGGKVDRRIESNRGPATRHLILAASSVGCGETLARFQVNP
jgi:hypothetical protein